MRSITFALAFIFASQGCVKESERNDLAPAVEREPPQESIKEPEGPPAPPSAENEVLVSVSPSKKEAIPLEPLKVFYVKARSLSVRAAPGFGSPIIDRLPKGRRVIVSGREGSWFRIGDGRYVFSPYLQAATPSKGTVGNLTH